MKRRDGRIFVFLLQRERPPPPAKPPPDEEEEERVDKKYLPLTASEVESWGHPITDIAFVKW